MHILGLDIGYSNLKLAYGAVGQIPKDLMIPSGAAPERSLPHGIRMAGEGIKVEVEGEPWCIGLPHGRFDQSSRSLHENYSESGAYKALFHGALRLTPTTRIDKLVTGLPVAQWQDVGFRQQLVQRLQGQHTVAPEETVDIEKVEVIPQPLGAYLDRLWQADADAKVLSEGRVLIVDPGFYSVDWIVIEAGALRKSGSGSSLDAMSVLIREAATEIDREQKGQVSLSTIEDALRRNRREIFLYGRPLILTPYLETAARRVSFQALDALHESLRREQGSIDVVILAGGGAQLYQEAVRTAFGQSRIMMSEAPTCANARGFFYFGEM